jgi:hypothetical protein
VWWADEYTDFFEIKYTPAGRMSAAMTSPLHITFRPKLNQDIHTAIPFVRLPLCDVV